MQKHAVRKLTIREELATVAGRSLRYRLCAVGNRDGALFRIEVSSEQESGEMCAGCDLLRALDYYQRILRGGVTPCTLGDIEEDLQYPELF